MKLKSFLLLAIAVLSCSARANDRLGYFKNTYEECDSNFNEIFSKILVHNPKAEVFQYLYEQGNIKTYFVPATESADHLLILISGTHGIEAFAGSAVQRHWLDQDNLNLKHTSLLLIHGFNLFGFKNERRVNENNVDLNRSFILNRSQFKPDDQKYALLDSFLNPSDSPSVNFLSRPLFIINAVVKIAQNSMEALRAAVLKGQYTYPKGIFYGGNAPVSQELMIDQLVARYVTPNYKKVLIVDLHTGYGARGRLHLLAGKSTEPNSAALVKVFGENQIDFADKKNFYAVEGEMIVYFAKKISEKTFGEISGVTFEFGTLDSQKTLGSIESLRRVVLENQNFHNPADAETSNEIKNLYREMFYPSSSEWRAGVLRQADERLKQVFSYLESN